MVFTPIICAVATGDRMEINMKTCTIENEHYTIKVSTKGAELLSVKSADGYDFIWQSHDGFWDSHAPLLFPACGRLLNQKYTYDGKEYLMDCHGFAKDVDFAVAENEGSRITLTYSSNEETKKIYPFDFLLVADYELKGSELKFTFTVTNKSKVAMPYMFGWHPGFSLPTGDGVDIESFKLDLGVKELDWTPLQNGPFACPVSKKYEIADGCYHLNEKEIYSNDTMIFTRHNNCLKMTADGSSYELTMKWSDNLPYLCIWKDESNAAKFVCLEPWSSLPADGVTPENFNEREMRRLDPGATEEFYYILSFKK